MGSSSGGDSGAEAAAIQARSNAKAIAETRRQFDITQANIQPFIDVGTAQLPSLEAGATVGGLDSVLGEIFGSDNFQNLVGERGRAVEGQLSSAGLSRSGTALEEAARVPTDLGFQLESLLSNRSSSLAGNAQTGVSDLGQFGAQASGQISSLIRDTGRAQASGLLADAQGDAAARQQRNDNLITAAKVGAGVFFSDPALKENVQEIGEAGDLKLYQWDWIPQTKGTMIEGCGTIGFMADEVKDKYPQHVYDFSGFMGIDYDKLLKELGDKYNADA